MKLSELVIAQESLRRILALELPAAVSYKVARAARPVSAELRSWEQERMKLVQRLGKDDGQGQVVVCPDHAEEFNAEINALLDVEVELAIRVVDPNILDGIDIGIKAGDLMLAWFLFEEPE